MRENINEKMLGSQGEPQEIEKAEEMLTKKQKAGSAERETTFEAGYKEGKGPRRDEIHEGIKEMLSESSGPYTIRCKNLKNYSSMRILGPMDDALLIEPLRIEDGKSFQIELNSIEAIYLAEDLSKPVWVREKEENRSAEWIRKEEKKILLKNKFAPIK